MLALQESFILLKKTGTFPQVDKICFVNYIFSMYYHLSKTYHGNTVQFEPRVPATCAENEDKTIPRICFSATIKQCLMAIEGHDDWRTLLIFHHNQKFHVYAINGNAKVFRPTEGLVPDYRRTNEVWRLEPTTLIYKGLLGIVDSEPKIKKRN